MNSALRWASFGRIALRKALFAKGGPAGICYDRVRNINGKLRMRAIELTGDINEKHRLRANVPPGLPAGPVRLIVLLSEEKERDYAWEAGVAREWSAELMDMRQDIYTTEDGLPVNETG
jgi:hypothetical protein